MKLKILITCRTEIEASLIQTKLLDYEIDSILTNRNFSSLYPQFYGFLGSGVQVLVNEEDYEVASELVDVKNISKYTSCPNCNSKDISFNFGKLKFQKIFFYLLTLLTGSAVVVIKDSYKCKKCNTEF